MVVDRKYRQSVEFLEEKPKTMDYFTMLATRRPTVMQNILARVPKLAYSVPMNGLPAWHDLPLDRSLPYIRPPPKTICFTKGKMGAKLYPQPAGAPFNTCPSPAPEYDPQFDPNLRRWWGRQTVRHEPPCRPLEPPCTMAQFNYHRKMLHRVWSKLAFLELKRQDDKDRDAYTMRRIGEIRERQRYNALKAKIRNEQMQKVLGQKEEELRLKREDILNRQRKAEMRLQRCMEMKAERQRDRLRKAKEKKEKMRQKTEAAKEIARMKLVKTLKIMRISDNRVKRQLQANDDNRIKKMIDEDFRKWTALMNSQIERSKLKSDTMRIYTSNLHNTVKTDLKVKKHAKLWKDENLRSMQIANLKQFSDKEKAHVRSMKKQLIRSWKSKLSDDYYCLMRKPKPSPPDDLLTEAVHSAINARSESMTSFDRAEYWIEKWEHVPKQVRAAINNILGRVIVKVTIPSIVKVLNDVWERCFRIVNRRINDLQNQSTRAKANPENKEVRGGGKKCIPRSPSQQDLRNDTKEENNAPSELVRSTATLKRILTQIIRDHVMKGYDPTLMEVLTLPRTSERLDGLDKIAVQLAVFVSHTRSKDITVSGILVRKTAEDMLREVVRLVKEEKNQA